MGRLTEPEIFDQMATSCRLSIEHCETLAVSPIKGPTYLLFREQMKLLDGCCRQASAWREDTRWLNIANAIHEARNRASSWLRGVIVEGERRRLADAHAFKCFSLLAQNLKAIQLLIVQTRDGKTGTTGAILPTPLRDNRARNAHRVILPGSELVPASKIILPGGAA